MNTVDQQLFDYASQMARHAEAFAHLRDVLTAVAQSDQRVTELNAQIEKIKADVATAEAAHDVRIKQLDDQYAAYQNQHNNRLESVVNGVDKQIKAKEDELNACESELNAVVQELVARQKDFVASSDAMQNEIANLKTEKAQLEADINELKQRHGLK